MIKPIKIVTALNYTKYIFVKCDKCGFEGEIYLDNDIINLDNNNNILEKYKIPDCSHCNSELSE